MMIFFSGFSEVIGAHLNFWPLYTNRKYPILTHVIGAVAPSLLIPEKEQKHVFPIKKIIEHTLEESGYLHIQGICFVISFGVEQIYFWHTGVD